MGEKPKPKPSPPSPVVRSFYALRIAGSPGHVHSGALFVHGAWSSFLAELRSVLERDAVQTDLSPGAELEVGVFEDGALRQRVDLIPHLRLHQRGPRRALGRAQKLTTLLADPAKAEAIATAIRTRFNVYELRVRWSELGLPTRLRNPVREGEHVRVPRWTELEELGLPDWIAGVGWTSTLDSRAPEPLPWPRA